MTKRLTKNEIAVRIVPTHLRWPEAGASLLWRRLHECVQQLHEFARAVDDNCCEIEQGREVSRDEIVRHRAEIGHEALMKLAAFGPFQIAKQAASKEIETLQKREDLTSQEAQGKQRLMMAMDELRDGIAAMERLLRERCKVSAGSACRPVCY
ncbi:hypothetical protein [Bradyrhizobium sp. 174]|uniref:hypothetical protein n=1 Tax=Bradyrhizobium sp. 174 TaxID=2782645 RepID=UPI001FF77DE0|nr:hypothetical protein [Bradyrhizobium sp. 174]MCK1570792.1 hypothetical protein [Bradyrhizobium sp. 174]